MKTYYILISSKFNDDYHELKTAAQDTNHAIANVWESLTDETFDEWFDEYKDMYTYRDKEDAINHIEDIIDTHLDISGGDPYIAGIKCDHEFIKMPEEYDLNFMEDNCDFDDPDMFFPGAYVRWYTLYDDESKETSPSKLALKELSPDYDPNTKLKSVYNFEPWSGAVDVFNDIKDNHKLGELQRIVDDLYPEGITESGFNDFLWFESEWLYRMLRISEE